MGKGRRTRLPMKLIEDPKHRLVSFSKRKKGLFAKCAALSSIFSGNVQVAAVVFSQHGKPFSFGHPSPDAVLRRYLSKNENPAAAAVAVNGGGSFDEVGSWWESADVEHMGLEELVKFKSSLEKMKNRVVNKVLELGVGGESEIQNGRNSYSMEDVDGRTYDWLDFDELLGVDQLGDAQFANDSLGVKVDHLCNAGFVDDLLGVKDDHLGNAGFADDLLGVEVDHLGTNGGFVDHLAYFSKSDGGLMEIFRDCVRRH